MVDVAFSEERSVQFDFTQEAVLNSWGELYVKKDSLIDSILDLKNKKIAITKSSVYGSESEGIEDYLKAFGLNATIIEVDEHIQVLYLVDTGMADAGIVSHIFGMAHQSEFSDLEATKIFLKPTELKFALTKNGPNNKYLIEKLDYWTKELKVGYEGYYNKSLIKHGLAEPQESQSQEKFGGCSSVCYISTISSILGTLVISGLLFRYSKPLQTLILKRRKTTNPK